MGNSSALGGEVEERDVLIFLHGVHNVGHSPTESYYGMATNHCAGLPDEIAFTSDRAATLRAGLDSVISIRLHLHDRGTPASQDRAAGQVSIPVREMLLHCGPAIFQTWLVLEDVVPYDAVIITRAGESFKHALRDVPSKVRSPRICVSLMETFPDPSRWIEDEATQVMYYDPLLVSLSQHLQLEQSYLEELDSGEWGMAALASVDLGSQSCQLRHQRQGTERSEIIQLKSDLAAITVEANRRIEIANGSILQMKGQLREMAEKDAPSRKCAHAQAKRRMEDMEASRQKLQTRLDSEDCDQELEDLRREVMNLSDQKEALMDSVVELNRGAKSSALLDVSTAGANLLPDPQEVLRRPS